MARRVLGRGRLLVSSLILLGVLLLLSGWRVSGYVADLLLNIGTAILLFAPLLYLQNLMEKQVAQVREETRSSVKDLSSELAEVRRQANETAARLDQLGEATRARIKNQQEADDKAFEEFEKEPSRGSLSRLLSRALQLNAISSRGVRVEIPGAWDRLRFVTGEARYVDGAPAKRSEEGGVDEPDGESGLWATIESLYGESLRVIDWSPGERAEEFMSKVAVELQSMGRYRDDTFDAERIMRSLKDTLRFAIEGRTGVGQFNDLAPIIEIPNDQWVIQTAGMSSPRYGYFIPAHQVERAGTGEEPPGESLHKHMKEKTWVDPDKFDMACDIARGLYEAEKKRLEPPF